MKEQQFDFKALAKQTFDNWKKFFRDNFVFTKVINTKEISDPIVSAIQDKEIPVISPDEISSPIVDALYRVQEAVELKEGVETVTVQNIGEAKTDLTEAISVLREIRDKEELPFPTIPEPKETVKIDGEVTVSKPSWWKQTDLSETNKVLKEISKKEFPKFPSFPEFPNFSDIFQKALFPIKEVLDKILSKKIKEYPLEFDEYGRLKVNVDRAGGGGVTAGLATEETLLAISTGGEKLASIADTTTSTIYSGEAVIGSATSSAVWRISKTDTSSPIIVTTWAGGGSFNQVWDNRAALSYA